MEYELSAIIDVLMDFVFEVRLFPHLSCTMPSPTVHMRQIVMFFS